MRHSFAYILYTRYYEYADIIVFKKVLRGGHQVSFGRNISVITTISTQSKHINSKNTSDKQKIIYMYICIVIRGYSKLAYGLL